jgi:hypothetical protein
MSSALALVPLAPRFLNLGREDGLHPARFLLHGLWHWRLLLGDGAAWQDEPLAKKESRSDLRVNSSVGNMSLHNILMLLYKIRKLAEREGFEPSRPRKGPNGFRDRPDRPLWHLSAVLGTQDWARAAKGARRATEGGGD